MGLEHSNILTVHALAKRELLARVKIENDKVILYFKEPYQENKYLNSIKKSFYNLYHRNAGFQEKFFSPQVSTSGHLVLPLKKDHGYQSDEQAFEAIIDFAQPEKKINVRALLKEGKLVESVKKENDKIKLNLQEKYNTPFYFKIVNRGLYRLYHNSNEFAQIFEKPKQGMSHPTLILQQPNKWDSERSIHDKLIELAKTDKNGNLPVKQLFINGELLTGIVLKDKLVKLELKEKYNNPANYLNVQQSLNYLYTTSPAFQEKFYKPKIRKNKKPCLILKDGHGYKNPEEISAALNQFYSSGNGINLTKLLTEGKLIDRITKSETRIDFIFKNEYSSAQVYIKFNALLHSCYKDKNFNQTFELPHKGQHTPYLVFKQDEQFVNDQVLFDKVVNLISQLRTPRTRPSKYIGIKSALGQGRLLADVILQGNLVTLLLNPEYKNIQTSNALRSSLRSLYDVDPTFQKKFELIKSYGKTIDITCHLKEGHGFKNANEIKTALEQFASKSPYAELRKALTARKLFKGIQKEGSKVKLLVFSEYDESYNYVINLILNRSYPYKTMMQEWFLLPRPGTHQPELRLKPEHESDNEQAIFSIVLSMFSHTQDVIDEEFDDNEESSETENSKLEVSDNEEQPVFSPGLLPAYNMIAQRANPIISTSATESASAVLPKKNDVMVGFIDEELSRVKQSKMDFLLKHKRKFTQ